MVCANNIDHGNNSRYFNGHNGLDDNIYFFTYMPNMHATNFVLLLYNRPGTDNLDYLLPN